MATESKQIDGIVDDPENGGLKSGPCLIAGFRALSCTSPSYYNPYRGVNKNTLSVDMVRLSLTFKGDRGEWLSRKGAQLTDCDEMSAWTSKIRPGGWYELWSFALGGSSVALGIGFMEPSCKVNIRHCYDYLIHDTDSCRKQGKEQYDPSRRVTGNNFDIGAYEQISSAQKQEMLKELVGYIIANGFTTINDFTVAAMNDFDGCYWEIIVGYNGTLERYCRGNYLKRKAKAEARDADE